MARRHPRRPTRGATEGGPGARRVLVRWLVFTALLVCFLLLQRGLWFTTSGLPHGWHLAAQVRHQKQENADLKSANGERWEEVKDLKHGTAAIEEHARMDLGLVKKGETFYQIVTAPAYASAGAPATSAAPVPASGRGGD